MEDYKDKLEGVGFTINDEVVIGDLTDVKEDKRLLPPVKGAKLRIKKVGVISNESGSYKQLNIGLSLEDGIDGKYKGSRVWAKVCYFADMNATSKKGKKYSEIDFFKKQQHLLDLKKLSSALGLPLAGLKINDEFCNSILERVILGDIWQKINSYTNKDGLEISETINVVSNFKPIPMGQLV